SGRLRPRSADHGPTRNLARDQRRFIARVLDQVSLVADGQVLARVDHWRLIGRSRIDKDGTGRGGRDLSVIGRQLQSVSAGAWESRLSDGIAGAGKHDSRGTAGLRPLYCQVAAERQTVIGDAAVQGDAVGREGDALVLAGADGGRLMGRPAPGLAGAGAGTGGAGGDQVRAGIRAGVAERGMAIGVSRGRAAAGIDSADAEADIHALDGIIAE